MQPGEPHTSPDLPYTSRAKRVLEKAMIAARDLGHDYVGAEHLLLALAQDDGVVGRALAAAGADEQAVRRETLAVLSEDPGRAP
jgi:ATP-dependent Clp protease ATP-binding subunit ClpC